VVHYGPVDPKAARILFIHHALVEEDYESPAPFFAHNAKLIDEVRELEAKTRNRDYLVDSTVRFEFYDKKLPHDIFNGQLFETWRRNAERHNPRLLYMTRRDLMKRSADDVTPDAFPDEMLVNGNRLGLEYALDPGEAMDGVTVTVPLAALNQLPDEPFEWLVPGLLREKALELIRTLPKAIRVNYVPAPDWADKATEKLMESFGQGSLYTALATVLGKFTGLPVGPEDVDPKELAPFLHMNFHIVDQQGKVIAQGREMPAIRKKLGLEARKTFSELPPDPKFHRDNITRWDFGDLPQRIEIKRYGVTLGAYPALVDKAESVSLRLFDTHDAARVAHRDGVYRLFMLELGPELRHLWRRIPNFDRMAMHYKLLGNTDELRSQIVTVAAGRAFAPDEGIRTHAEFVQRAGTAWNRLAAEHVKVSALAEMALVAFYEVTKALQRPFAPLLEPSAMDMRQHLARLMPKDFVAATPGPWLEHLPRFIKGISIRLGRLLNAGLTKDQQGMLQIGPLEAQLAQKQKAHRAERRVDRQLITYRWMLEEFRVSLFAQELKTSIPVSSKRLADQWMLVK